MKQLIVIASLLVSISALADTCAYQNVPKAEIEEIIAERSKHYGIEKEFIWAIVKEESGFDPCVVSNAGAIGLMQLMPGTASEHGVTDPYNPQENINTGTKIIISYLQKYEAIPLALAAYNAGTGTLQKYRMIPPYDETKKYVRRVMNTYEKKKGLRSEWLVWSSEQDKKE
jgi:soluble lytic murein transglycosylase-like protein